MKRFILISLAVLALAIPAAVLAGSGQTGFNGVVNTIASRYHVHATRIPFMGIISLVSSKATHGSVSNFHIAEFDSFTDQVDGSELNSLVEEKLGQGWERMIRETGKEGHKQTLIFIHPEGDRIGMFVVDLDGNELDVVQVSVDPRHLDDDIGHYSHHHNDDDKDSDKGDDQSD